MEENKKILLEGLLNLPFFAGDSAKAAPVLALLEQYRAEIERFNPLYKLVGVRDSRELIIRHLLDSLSGLDIIRRYAGNAGARIADAGSGAGLPGVPLAIALPEHHFTLIERMGRRAGFLENTCAVLGLPNISVEEREIEKAAPNRFHIIVFRAFKPLEQTMVKNLCRLLLPDGILAAYKGKKSVIDKEIASLGALSAGWTVLPAPAPFLPEERHIALFHAINAHSLSL
jgi:16S rRNA (guanine527-N7)-methyltransferase